MEPSLRNDQRDPVADNFVPPTPKDFENSGYSLIPLEAVRGISKEQSIGDTVFNSINDAILIIGEDATIELVNPATVEMTGFSVEELVGGSAEILTHNRRLFDKIFKRSLHTSILGNRFEMRCRRKDGSAFPVSVSTTSIHALGSIQKHMSVSMTSQGNLSLCLQRPSDAFDRADS